jgi:hypothetical protein
LASGSTSLIGVSFSCSAASDVTFDNGVSVVTLVLWSTNPFKV